LRRSAAGDTDRALEHFENSYQTLGRLLEANPTSVEAARDVSESLEKLEYLRRTQRPLFEGSPPSRLMGGQHMLDADYFRRIDAFKFAMAHDGQLSQDLNAADIIILGISRTSKTPTSIYLALRGYKTANLTLVPGIEPPQALLGPHRAFVVGLVASPERIAKIRRNRLQMLGGRNRDEYVDRIQVANELSYSRRLCTQHGWPIIDVTHQSIEETAAAIIQLLHDREEAAADGPR
jgi:regulator of PEP synthase PpsR (kinase-PPPase family)